MTTSASLTLVVKRARRWECYFCLLLARPGHGELRGVSKRVLSEIILLASTATKTNVINITWWAQIHDP
jgi:hypothetical protein